MINPSSIDLNSLPWLPLDEKTAFPKRSAIYFAIDSLGNVRYIGRSKNVHSRWGSHHKYSELSEIGNIKIAYLFVDLPELLPGIERALIEYFDPPLNAFKLLVSVSNLKVICKLKNLMDDRGITQLALAEATGLAPSTIGRLYRNQITRIDTSTVTALSEFFDLRSISELLEIQR